jgi:hypothetical protein
VNGSIESASIVLMTDVRTELVKAKRKLETDLQKLLETFESETGLSVHDIRLSRGEVTGNTKPALTRVETTVQLISG